MKTVAFIPIKLNNERVPGKNIRPLSDGTPLVHLIQKTLLKTKLVDEIYVYCSNDCIKDFLLDGVKYLKRDEKFDRSDAKVNDMFLAFSNTVKADVYVLAHATAPLQTAKSIDKGIEIVMSGEYDSALAVRKIMDFLWIDGKPFNYSIDKIPRTQDLKPTYAETTGLYIYNYDVIQNLNRRIGNKPYLLEVDAIEATDINYPDDFEIADALYMHMLNKSN